MESKLLIMQDHFECGICYLIMHKAVSVMPCMHTFCGGCLSDWFKKQKDCPVCRVKATEVKKNQLVNNFIDSYLTIHPQLKREELDIKAQEEKNIFKSDSVRDW